MSTLDPHALAAHLLRTIATARVEGRTVSLPALASEVGARKADVRAALTRLHHEGAYDAVHNRPTLKGFALGISLSRCNVPSVRRAPRAAHAA